jgi:hypothetical protein
MFLESVRIQKTGIVCKIIIKLGMEDSSSSYEFLV